MSKLHDWIFSARCKFCHEKLINQKVYVVRETSTTGLGNLVTYTKPVLYEAVNCPRCGKQMIIGKHLRIIDGEVKKNEHSIEDL